MSELIDLYKVTLTYLLPNGPGTFKKKVYEHVIADIGNVTDVNPCYIYVTDINGAVHAYSQQYLHSMCIVKVSPDAD